MLTQRLEEIAAFTRRDFGRFVVVSVILVLALTGIFAVDILPQRLQATVGSVARADILAPRTDSYVSEIQTVAARDRAASAVENQYDYSTEKAIAIASRQLALFEMKVEPIDGAFAKTTPEAERADLLDKVLPGDLSEADRATLKTLTLERWTAIRAEASRILGNKEQAELRETDVTQV
jgi:membrane-associated HD superfamily phosphohydrolase